MTIKRTMLALALLLVGCEAVAPTPSPFRPEDNVVPVALEPDRPRPPPPSKADVQRVPRAPSAPPAAAPAPSTAASPE